MGVSG
jgi:two-component system, cell cycle response regulator DivK